MVMTGGETELPGGGTFVDRNTFYDIGDEGWKWKKDRSFDGGQTWIEGVVLIEARRASDPDPTSRADPADPVRPPRPAPRGLRQ